MESSITEAIRKNWGLPEQFGKAQDGAGIVLTTIGYCSITAVWLLKLQKLKSLGFDISKTTNHPESKFALYYYDVAHSHVQKASILNDIKHTREIGSIWDPETLSFRFDYEKLDTLMGTDISNGLIPLVAFGVFGATSNGGSDDINTLTSVCKKHGANSIVDAAWAGSFTCNEEFRFYMDGVENVDFYLLNFSKCGGSGMESALLYMQEKTKWMQLVQENTGKGTEILSSPESDYLNILKIGEATKTGIWKLHFMLQENGMDGFKAHITKCVELAKYIEAKIGADSRFEIVPKRVLALTCFRLKQKDGESDEDHEKRNFDLVGKLSEDGKIFVVAGKVCGIYFIRIAVHNFADESDYDFFYERSVEVCEENGLFLIFYYDWKLYTEYIHQLAVGSNIAYTYGHALWAYT